MGVFVLPQCYCGGVRLISSSLVQSIIDSPRQAPSVVTKSLIIGRYVGGELSVPFVPSAEVTMNGRRYSANQRKLRLSGLTAYAIGLA